MYVVSSRSVGVAFGRRVTSPEQRNSSTSRGPQLGQGNRNDMQGEYRR